ncbi:MAG: hypothetical protein LH470_03095 [Lysobacter sp.]|nr:hypothetical protein [Lysobacter sp.]
MPVPALGALLVVAVIVGALFLKDRSIGTPPAANPAPNPMAAPVSGPATYPQGSGNGAPSSPAARQAVARIIASREQAQTDQSREATNHSLAAGKAYAGERRDSAWAAAKEQELQAIAGGAGMKAAGVEVNGLSMHCKRTLCEIIGAFPDQRTADEWVLAYMASLGNAASSSVVSRERAPAGGTKVRIVSRAR